MAARFALLLCLATTSALAPMPFSRRWSRTAQRPAVTGGEIVKASDGEAKLAVGAACAGAVLFGYHLGVVNAPLDAMARSLKFGEATAGAVVSSTLVGATGGALIGGAAADAWGRRGAMLRNSALLAAAAAGCATAATVNQLLAARFAAGARGRRPETLTSRLSRP